MHSGGKEGWPITIYLLLAFWAVNVAMYLDGQSYTYIDPLGEGDYCEYDFIISFMCYHSAGIVVLTFTLISS